MLVGRLLDGTARELWPADVVSDEDLAHARQLLDVLHYAFRNADFRWSVVITPATAGLEQRLSQRCAARRARLPEAIDLLLGKPTTERDRLLGYAEHVAHLVGRLREAEAGGCAIEQVAAVHLSVFGLAHGVDPAFAKLSEARVREALRSVVSPRNGKGGARNLGADHVAAELAVEVNAFGASRTGDFDRDVDAFKARLRKERHKALTRKTSPDE